ncbi:MAG TPA: KR domain-containing protein, partial [Verrucomicrobiae bacterium]|nr:KR domain-containing protein [Verrucomicrobiae bacterium]
MGSNEGEYVAACLAGLLSLEDALRLVVQGSRTGANEVGPSPENAHHATCIEMASTVTGAILDADVPFDASYRARLTLATPRIEEATRALAGRGIRVFLEMGPGLVLTQSARQVVDGSGAIRLVSSLPARDEWHQLLACLGSLFVHGLTPNWAACDKPYRRRKVALPSYPFQRQRFWLPVQVPSHSQSGTNSPGLHPMLGMHVPLANEPGTHVWQGEISLLRCPWLKDHQVQGAAIVPATAFIELAVAAAAQTLGQPPFVLSGIEIEKVLRMEEGRDFILQTRLQHNPGKETQFEVFSCPKGGGESWTRHARGRLSIGSPKPLLPRLAADSLNVIRQRCPEHLDGSEFYRFHHQRGNGWGPAFQGVRSIWRGQGEALSEVEAPAIFRGELNSYQFHPAFSDASGHVLTATVPLEKVTGKRDGAFVGAGIEEIRFYRHPEGDRLWAYARLRQEQSAPENILVGDVQVYDRSGNLVSETLGARLWYLEAAAATESPQAVDSWLYEPGWVQRPASDEPRNRVACAGTWIIFTDSKGVGEALACKLRAGGAHCVLVRRSEGGFHANGTLGVRPEVLEDYLEAISSASQVKMGLRGVVHLWSLDAAEPEGAEVQMLSRAQLCGSISVLRLVQALEKSGAATSAKLWLVTQGAQPAGENPSCVSPFQSPLWGLGRSIGVEQGNLWGGLIDLDPLDAPDLCAELLLNQITNPEGEDQVAFRNRTRQVLRLVRGKGTTPQRDKLPIRPEGSYLITGGLGGLGLALAQWLADQGAKHLVLVGRTPLPGRSEWGGLTPDSPEARRVAAITSLERKGVEVRTFSADMSDEHSVSLLLGQLVAEQEYPLCGVIHAAGVMQYQPLVTQTPDEMRQLFGAKITGAWLLHRGLADANLDFFVLFSSSSSLLSSPLMGAYSAANAFLDALAHYRRGLGLPALSINWGTWSETGMATRFTQERKLERHGRSGATKGIGVLSTQQALSAFARLMEGNPVQAGVMPIDWQEWRRAYGHLARTPYLSLVLPDTEAVAEETSAGQAQAESIRSAPASTRAELLDAYLARTVARILRVPLSSVDPEKSISHLGFDSLMSLELRTQLEKDLTVKVAMAQLLEGPTLTEL